MKFKLGLLMGGTVGYLVGSGKGAEMVSELRSRSGRGGGQSAAGGDSLLDFSDGAEAVYSETFIATDAPLRSDM